MGLMASTPVHGRRSDLLAPWENNHGAATQRVPACVCVFAAVKCKGVEPSRGLISMAATGAKSTGSRALWHGAAAVVKGVEIEVMHHHYSMSNPASRAHHHHHHPIINWIF